MSEHNAHDKDMYEVIQRVKRTRVALGLSYQELADKTGISKSTLQRYETGSIKNLGVDKLEVLATALDTSPAYLMGWVDKAITNTTKSFTSPKDAMKYLLSIPVLMNYGGYDVKDMSDEELLDFANELLHHLELVSHKFKSK